MGKQLSVEQCCFFSIQARLRKTTRIICIIRRKNKKKVVFREEVEKNILCFREKVPYTFLFFVI